MGNPIKDAFDIAGLERDIVEREQYIKKYKIYGILNREKVIEKILELREKDKEVCTAYYAEMTMEAAAKAAAGKRAYFPALSDCSNQTLINELQKQIDLLQAKLITKKKTHTE